MASLAVPLQKIEQGEDEDPHQVDEVPVQPGHLDPLRRRLAHAGADGGDDQDDESREDVGAVEAGEYEEGLGELRGSPGVPGKARALVYEVAPLVRLAAEEAQPPHDREDEVVQ